MILAASMAPTPKISVRVVPDASYLGFDASMEVCDLSLQCPHVAQDLRSQPPAEARRGTLGPYAAYDAGGSVGRERSSYPAGDEIPQKPVEAVERPGVRSATKSSRLSVRRRSTSDSASGSTAARRSLREAANAVARASNSSFLRALPLESIRTRAESLGGTSTTDSPAAANLWARPTSGPGVDRGPQRSLPPNDAWGTVSPSVREPSSLL